MLARTGSDPLTIAWAREHHSPEAAWSVPVEVGRALRAGDQEVGGRPHIGTWIDQSA